VPEAAPPGIMSPTVKLAIRKNDKYPIKT